MPMLALLKYFLIWIHCMISLNYDTKNNTVQLKHLSLLIYCLDFYNSNLYADRECQI